MRSLRRIGFVAVLALAAAVSGLLLLSAPRARSAPLSPPRSPEGLLEFHVRDEATTQPIPCKLTFVGTGGTPTPAFTHGDIGRGEGDGVIAAYDRVMATVGDGSVRVPYGRYEVWVSRGLEWTAVQRNVEIGATGTAVLEARLAHVIDSDGWLSGDFHVHAAPSPDSVVPLEHRVIEFVADGVELIVSTDHNVVADYGPSIRQLGVGALIASVTGDEVTTASWGHFGAFPLPQDIAAAGSGALHVHGRTPAEMFSDLRARAPHAVIDIHHPRLDPEIGYFTIGGLDPHADRATHPGFSFDFDAVEVLNGYQDPVRAAVDRTIDDWMGLINHGHVVTATGNSDTHHLTYNIGGYPRNYVRLHDDRPVRVTAAALVDAVKGHHAFFTTGPFVRVTAPGGGIGDVVLARGGRTTVDVQVDAAPWLSIDRVILYVDGREAQRWRVPPSQAVMRFKRTIPLQFAQDGYVVVRVDGDRLMAPIVGDTKRFGVRPLALANPIFFDVDGDGKYAPPWSHGAHTARK